MTGDGGSGRHLFEKGGSHREVERGVVFDLDGTLADTIDDISEAINISLRQCGQVVVTVNRVRSLIGSGLRDLFGHAAETDDDAVIDDLVAAYRPAYERCMLRQTRLYEGIDSMLEALTTGGLAFAVLSNKPDEFTVPICASLLGAYPFVACCGARHESTRKPNPVVALDLAREMGCQPESVFFVGDSPVDIKTAKAAGMQSIAVTWGYRDADVLAAEGPDHLVSRPEHVVALLMGEVI